MGLLAVLCGCGTEGKGAYVHLTTVLIKNNSMYDIEIVVEKPSTVSMTGTFTVKNGTTFKIEKASEGGYYVPNPLEAQIKFDDGTAITHREMDGDAVTTGKPAACSCVRKTVSIRPRHYWA